MAVKSHAHSGKTISGIVISGLILVCFTMFVYAPAEAGPPIGTFYYPPGNVPPGPPPNYNQVDTSYFMGTPNIPLPPPDSGGIYIWVDSSGWNIANHIYSQGYSFEQFHGSVLAMLDSQPAPGVNIITDGFELYGDTTAGLCYKQNDRWGWYQWAENLYEIWWDVSTREWKEGGGDPNDFMLISITGCAIDFNVWSSGHGDPFNTDQIYLGGNMVRLSDIPGFIDTYPGITDPYQPQAGSHPDTDPNITVFASILGTGATYNKDGIINSGQSYPCGPVLGQNYGDRFGGTFVYEGNGVQFSSSCLTDPCAFNDPPVASSPADTGFFVCDLSEICLPGFTVSDPDDNLLSVEVTGGTLNGDTVCFTPVKGTNTITLICTDECGASDTSVTVVTVTQNVAPFALAPPDTAIFACDQSQICIPGFFYGDNDGNMASVVVSGGTLTDNTICFTPIAGANTLTLVVTDDCGLADTALTVVTVEFNDPPAAVAPGDTSLFVCDLSQICIPGFTYSDPDGNIASVDVNGGTLAGNEICFVPVEGANIITLIVTDDCGLSDTASTTVTIDLNEPPSATGPADTSIFVCDLSQICIPGFSYSDPDGNISSVTALGGTLNGSEVCFAPLEGSNSIGIIVTDDCGAADTTITAVTVTLNQPPVAESPNDTSLLVCDLSQICVPGFGYSDPDGNISTVAAVGGTLNGSEVCFTPVEGSNNIGIIVTDDCGSADTSIAVVTVTLNQPPVAESPNDTSMLVCDLSQICIPGFGYSDPDGNIAGVEISGGTLSNGTVCFIPIEGNNIISLIVTDDCGLSDTALTTVTVDLNSPPAAESPVDTSMMLCGLEQICLPGFVYSDPDNNITSVEVSNGTLNGGTVCFTPVAGDNSITLTVTDACGVVATSTTVVTVSVNSAPVASCPGDTSISFVCDVSEICVGPFTAADVDGNIDSSYISIDGFSGTFDGTNFCFTPNLRAVYEVNYITVDLCGEADTCAMNINVQLTNEPPTAGCPGDTTIVVCDLADVCLPGFSYNDSNNNIEAVNVTGGTYVDGNVCFTPSLGENTIALTVTDSCGLWASCTTTVTVNMNTPPSIACINDTMMVVDDWGDICLEEITFDDPDGNITNINITGGTLIDGQVCFTPNAGINSMTISVEDACGAVDTCFLNVIVGFCEFMPGDANADFNVNGVDVTIMVNFFKGGPALPDTCDCRPDVIYYPFFGAGDTNGNCLFNGVDVTYLYNYLAGIHDEVMFCPSCPPTWGWITSGGSGGAPKTSSIKQINNNNRNQSIE